MNIIDDISEIIRKTPIEGIDGTYMMSFDPTKAFEAASKFEHQMALRTMVSVYNDAIAKGIPADLALIAVVMSHEDLVRYVIMRAVKQRMNGMKIDDVKGIEIVSQLSDFTEKLQAAKDAMQKLDLEYKEKAKNATVDQFKAYLQYAADKWGSDDEKGMVASLVKKVKPEKIKK